MDGVFQSIDPPPPPPPPPPPRRGGWGVNRAERGVGGSIFWKTSDTALYSKCVSTLWGTVSYLSGDAVWFLLRRRGGRVGVGG
jgi:hypothetical protein